METVEYQTEIQLTLLTPGTPIQLPATTGLLSKARLRLLLHRPLDLDSAVRVDCRLHSDAALLLAEVVSCVPQGTQYAVSLNLRHTLLHLTTLHNLMTSLLRTH